VRVRPVSRHLTSIYCLRGLCSGVTSPRLFTVFKIGFLYNVDVGYFKESAYPPLAALFFLLVVIILPTMLLSSLIAVLVSSFKKANENAIG